MQSLSSLFHVSCCTCCVHFDVKPDIRLHIRSKDRAAATSKVVRLIVRNKSLDLIVVVKNFQSSNKMSLGCILGPFCVFCMTA